VMVNNAGLNQLSPLEEHDISGGEQMIDENLKGTLYSTAVAYPSLKSRIRALYKYYINCRHQYYAIHGCIC